MRSTPTLARQLGLMGSTDASAATAALVAFVLGVFLVLGTGFTHITAIHNAVHDTRHSAGFPCH